MSSINCIICIYGRFYSIINIDSAMILTVIQICDNLIHRNNCRRLEPNMEEKAYKIMGLTGGLNITLGVIAIVAGIASGVLLIVGGGTGSILDKMPSTSPATAKITAINVATP
mgnify:CR=1 FL=1